MSGTPRKTEFDYKRGRTERETCDLNGWGVGTTLRGHEKWADGRGIWTTIRITALGEESILARTIREERTDPDGTITGDSPRPDREGTWTLDLRDWRPVEVVTECAVREGDNRRCLYFACGERQDDRHTRWWCEFGCCGRLHAAAHYGEEAI